MGAAQVETGNPYMLYKDTCNRKSNQQNLGTIRCSNLCTEILEFTSPEETAVCNLASIALPRFVRERGATSDRMKLTGSINAPNRWGNLLCGILCFVFHTLQDLLQALGRPITSFNSE